MARATDSVYSLNRGVVSKLGLARMDVKRLALAAQQQTNWMPKTLGPMVLRSGWGYVGTVLDSARLIKFIFATDDTALLEMTDITMRVWENDVLLTRPAVSTVIVNGSFALGLTGWTDLDEGGATSSWSAGKLELQGNGTDRAIREQQVACLTPHVEHGVRVIINHGPVTIRIGSTSGDDDLFGESTLQTGTHSLSIKPAGDFFVRFFSSEPIAVFVEQCFIEAAGAVEVRTPWAEADLSLLRYDQSADVVFLARKDVQQRRIERRGTRPFARSWSVVLYQSPDGPFQIQNTGTTTLQPSAISGNITVSASQPMFKAGHVGKLYSIISIGQKVTVAAAGANEWSDSIRVVGLKDQRGISISVTGTFSATVILQQSFDDAVWADVAGESWTAPVATVFNDGLDNQIIFYRIGIEGTFASGEADCTLSIGQGSIRGIFRVTAYASPTLVDAEVLTDLGGTAASTEWEEGKWSDADGWPSAVAIHEGRMWWAGQNGADGSVSDAYDSFNEEQLGDAGPISRTIGSGPVDTVDWLLSLRGLVLGAQGAEYVARSSALDDPLTPSNFNLKACTTRGSGPTPAMKIDQSGYFVDRTGCKLFELAFNIQAYDFVARDLMELNPELGRPGIVRVDVQMKPEPRIHCVRTDGTVVVAVVNVSEQELAWVPVTTQGFVEDVAILPSAFGELDDQVYYVVRRSINGVDVRYLEKWAQEVDCRGGLLSYLADSFVSYTGAPKDTITVAHLPNQSVCVWADGVDVGTDDATWEQTLVADSAGLVTLPQAYANIVVGLPYQASFQSAKLGVQIQGSSPLNQQKKIDHVGFVCSSTHRKGLRYGPSFDYLDDMPEVEEGAVVTTEVPDDYDQNLIEFPGTWTTDSRICLLATAPRPACVLSITFAGVQNG